MLCRNFCTEKVFSRRKQKKKKKKKKKKTKQIVILATASVVTEDYLNLTIGFIKVLLKWNHLLVVYLRQIGLKCKSAVVTNDLIFEIVVKNKLASTFIWSVNQSISNKCPGNLFVFIDNSNISTSSLFRDGLQLLKVGKRVLGNNLIDNSNNFLQVRKTHRPPP